MSFLFSSFFFSLTILVAVLLDTINNALESSYAIFMFVSSANLFLFILHFYGVF